MAFNQKSARAFQKGVAALSIAAIAVSLLLARLGWSQSIESGGIKVLQAYVVAAWTLVPPAWFWFEYVFLYPHYGQSFEHFKYLQDVASKIWIAAISALLLLYFWKDISHPKA